MPLDRVLRWPAVLLLFWIASPASAIETLALAPDSVLVEDGTVSVTVADFDAAVAAMPRRQQETVAGREANIHNVIDSLFVNRLLAQEAREAGLDQDPAVKRALDQAVERVLAGLRLRQIEDAVDLSAVPQRARERYQANRERYRQAEQVDASHILVAVNEQRSDSEALARAEQVKRDLDAGGDFAELARDTSDDPGSAEAGGRLGFFGRDQMVQPFEEAAFASAIGEVTEPVRSDFGYHLILVHERHEARQLAFEEVRADIEAEFAQTQQSTERQHYLLGLRQREDARVNWDTVNALIAR